MNWRVVREGDIPRIIVIMDDGTEVPLSELIGCQGVCQQ